MGRQGARQPPRHHRGRAPRRAALAAPPGEVRFRAGRAAGRSLRPRRSRAARRGDQRPDDPRVAGDGQQRGRHHPAADRRHSPRPHAQGRGHPPRCGAGGAVPGHRHGRAGRRAAVDRGPQVRGAQGGRRAVHPPRHDPAAAAARRHAGALSPRRHGGCRRGRRHGRRLRPRLRRACGGCAAPRAPARPAARRAPRTARRRADRPPAQAAARGTCRSSCATRKARRSCSRSTWRASLPRPGRRARPARPSLRTCSPRWAIPTRRRAARCA